jgi:hypothetical protein
MNDFYVHSGLAPLDQADGLRRLFAGNAKRFVPLAANPHAAFSGVAIERLTAALALLGRHTLIVDAADTSPAVSEAAAIELAPCIETLAPQVSYLAARGLPLRYVNTRGSSARLLDELGAAAPQADVILVHAGAADLARLFTRRAARPVLLASDHPDSVKDAYASLKLLSQRCGWMSCDLLLLAAPNSVRVPHIASSLASCADTFIGAAVATWAAIDPAGRASEAPDAALCRMVSAQLHLDDDPLPLRAGATSTAAAASQAACH